MLPPWLLESCVLSTYHTVAYSRTLYVKCEWAWTVSLNICDGRWWCAPLHGPLEAESQVFDPRLDGGLERALRHIVLQHEDLDDERRQDAATTWRDSATQLTTWRDSATQLTTWRDSATADDMKEQLYVQAIQMTSRRTHARIANAMHVWINVYFTINPTYSSWRMPGRQQPKNQLVVTLQSWSTIFQRNLNLA